MTTDLWIQIISALAPTLMALAALITSIKNGAKADAAAVKTQENSQKIAEIHISLNSRLSQLLEASVAQGRVDERTDQRGRDEKTALIASDLKTDTAQIATDLQTKTEQVASDLKTDTAEIAIILEHEKTDKQ